MRLSLEIEILKAITYYSLFSYPLTTLEVWNHIRGDSSYGEVYNALHRSEYLTSKIISRNGMWMLRASLPEPDVILERQTRYRASKRKIDIARKFARLARKIPWIQEISACNSLGFLHARGQSDIDLFIVAKRGRIWCARFFAVLLAKLFGRPSKAHTKDFLCLSFFAVEGARMKKLTLAGDDIYFRNWLSALLPLYRRVAQGGTRRGIGNTLEKILRALQMRIMPAHLKAMANKGTSVVITEEFLKFHDHDRRAYFRKEYESRFSALV